MKFLHTADWQIGMKAAHTGVVAERLRGERLEASSRVITAATNNGAEFILVAGDTFEDNGVDRVVIQKVGDILASFGGPVYLIPGNHDPLVPGSVWEHPVWKSTENLHVLVEPQPLEIPGGILYPCPLREKHSRKDPTGWITNSAETKDIRIGLAHGAVESERQLEPDYPLRRDAAVRAGLDYLALGHWHSTATYVDPTGAVRMAYSGTHEPTRFGERESGNVLLVEVSARGCPLVITSVKTSGLVWEIFEEEIRQAGDLAAVRKRIESLQDPSITLVEVRLSGLLAPEEQEEILRLGEILASRFLFGRVDVSRLRPSPEDESWLAGLPVGIMREAAARLQELATPVPTLRRDKGASAEIASHALLELYRLAQEVKE